MRLLNRSIAVLALLSLLAAVSACAGASTSDDVSSDTGTRLVSVDDAAALLADPPDDLIVLDVRTPEEFADARLADATMIDFYEADFADRIAELDRDASYLLYCRSGNRSGQTLAMMEELGFTNVADVDGGINVWLDGGHPVTSG